MKFIMFLRNATGEQQTRRGSRRLAGGAGGAAGAAGPAGAAVQLVDEIFIFQTN